MCSGRCREVKCNAPLQDLQTTILPEEPVGSQSEESLDEGERRLLLHEN